MPLNSGTKLAQYEVVEPIGAGGMGEVYRARDTKLGRDVAIKVLPEEFANDDERLARFEREAKLLASLNHPNIASIYGFESGALVLELVEGPTLAERIQRGPIPVGEAITIAKQIAEALEAGHDADIIHRDVKPANIKIKENGTVKVLDYGLAKALEGEVPARTDSESSQSPTLLRQPVRRSLDEGGGSGGQALTRQGTHAGVILGTAAYMSPEQARGKAVDKRTDIWAFGAVLFEMLSGKPAFLGETASDTIARILEREPSWKALPKATPVGLRNLLNRCLRKERDRRLHDIADARIELEDVLFVPLEKREPSPGGLGRGSLVVTALVAAALALIVSSLLRPTASTSMPITHSSISVSPAQSLALGGNDSNVAISPDGRLVAYVGNVGDSRQLYLRRLDQPTSTPIDGTLEARMPFFSPDSQWLGFMTAEKLMKVALAGGPPILIAEGLNGPRGASWGSDGWIVYTPSWLSGLSRISEEGGEPEVLTVLNREEQERTHRQPEVLPGGRAVLFTIGTAAIMSYDEASIAVVDVATGEYHAVVQGGANARYSSTGHLIYARSGSLLAVPFDLSRLETSGSPIPVAQGVATSPLVGHAEFGVARNGTLLYAAGDAWGNDSRVVWVDRQGRASPLVETPGAYFGFRLSPDGRVLALDVDGANPNLWLYDLARGTLGRATFEFQNSDAVWTPDGNRFAFRSDRAGPDNIYWQAVAGGEAERLTTSDYNQGPASWSPDGAVLAFNELHPERGYDIWVLRMGDDRTPELFLQTPFHERRPVFSPNGRFIAYESDELGHYSIYLSRFPATAERWQVSAEAGRVARWSADGRELFYLSGDELMVVDVETDGELVLGKPKPLFQRNTRDTGFPQYDVAPNGEGFVMLDVGESSPPPTQLNLVQNWFEELKRLVPTEN